MQNEQFEISCKVSEATFNRPFFFLFHVNYFIFYTDNLIMAAVIEAQTRLTLGLRDIVSFFEKSEVPQRSIDILNDYLDKNLSNELLNLSESYGRSMAFINHDELIFKLYNGWNLMLEGFTIERKVIARRIRFLKEDKKTDPAVLIRLETLIKDLDVKKASVMTEAMRLKYMTTISIEKFKQDPNFDYETAYMATLMKHRAEKAILNEAKASLDKDKPPTPSSAKNKLKPSRTSTPEKGAKKKK